jgi:hypothetical protein
MRDVELFSHIVLYDYAKGIVILPQMYGMGEMGFGDTGRSQIKLLKFLLIPLMLA